MTKIFVDTNILVYAHDVNSGKKQEIAKDKIKELWTSKNFVPCISVQVLQEFYAFLLRKKIDAATAHFLIMNYTKWEVINNDLRLFSEGIHYQEKWKLSAWDAFIVAAAVRSNAIYLWSEDFSEGQVYKNVEIKNPLL